MNRAVTIAVQRTVLEFPESLLVHIESVENRLAEVRVGPGIVVLRHCDRDLRVYASDSKPNAEYSPARFSPPMLRACTPPNAKHHSATARRTRSSGYPSGVLS